MRLNKSLTNALITALLLGSVSFAHAAEPVVTRISVVHMSEHWLVEYTFDQPIREILFGPEVDGLRSQKWRILSSGLALESQDGEERLSGEQEFTELRLEVRSHDVFPPKNYAPTSGFSDGGSTLFLGFLMGDLVTATGETVPMDFTFELQARPGEAAFMPDQVHRGYRVHAYFGPLKPVETEFARLLIDGNTPAWLHEELLSLVPQVTELYARELGFGLPQKPLIMIAAGNLDSQQGHSVKGGAINGHILISLRGTDLYQDDARSMFQKLLSHEIAHLWQDGPAEVPLHNADPWVHEGGADALALAAVARLDLWTDDQINTFAASTTSQCDLALGSRTLSEAVAEVDWNTVYSCGFQLIHESGVDAFPLCKALIEAATATNSPIDQEMLARVAETELAKRPAMANGAYREGQFATAGRIYEELAGEGMSVSRRSGNAYNAACSYALAGDIEGGFRCLQEALEYGFSNDRLLASDSDLDLLHTDDRFASLSTEVSARATKLRDPAGARLITEDLHRFWTAHDKVRAEPDRAAEIFWEEYFLVGSNGLRDYYDSRIHSVDKFLANYNSMPAYYNAIREQTLRTEGTRGEFTAAFERLAELYDAAVFPDITFLIGRFNSMGTVSNAGLLISVDMLSAGEGVPLDDMSARSRSIVKDMNGLVPIVSHELIHSQQNVKTGTLLGTAVLEGGADFVAHMICGRLTSDEKYAWADANEEQVWRRFAADMHGTDITAWANNAGDGRPDWPGEMAYYVGYQICEAYYAQASDKREAIRAMLNCQDARLFLKTSGYAERWQ